MVFPSSQVDIGYRIPTTSTMPKEETVLEEPFLEPSELLRPEPAFATKPIAAFRDYTINPADKIKERVRKFYYDQHTNMTVDFVKNQQEKWCKFDHFKGTVIEILEKLSAMLDQSDPDVDVPNIVHAFQTAEGIRKEHPDKGWFQLAGLIHDMGKIMALFGEPQWAVTGDTFPVGCEWGPSIVYRDSSFENNPDGEHPIYSTKYGIYQPNCGLKNVQMIWGHDEYLYRFLLHNKSKLPEKAHWMIRYHSFYPWHAGGDYMHLCSEEDKQILEDVLEFNKYDLYTKTDEDIPDVEALKPYYQKLIDQYLPGVLEW